MRKQLSFKVNNPKLFKQNFLVWTKQYNPTVILDSNSYYKENRTDFSYNTYNFISGVGLHTKFSLPDFNKLKSYKNSVKDWLFGYLSYDLKNSLENLESNNIDNVKFPELYFFQPKLVFVLKENNLDIYYLDEYSENNINEIFNQILETEIAFSDDEVKKIKVRFTKFEYFEAFKKLKNHIKKGDIYELNFCQEFYCENTKIQPEKAYNDLINVSPTPFSAFMRIDNNYLISASPERFIKKEGLKIISQPIKGTKKKSAIESENIIIKQELLNDEKEQAENVMIVDLVRNDLSITAEKASVKVEELFGIYSFKQVHQMISTVVSKIFEQTDSVDVIKNAFPMGSMTGAPKIRAMQLIEQYEKTKRGLYSGAVGYFSPNNNFDFNVVIRSILYNSENEYLSFIVGGAITDKANAESEYAECLLKAEAMAKVLGVDVFGF